MKLIINKKPRLAVCSMKCDIPLHEKLDKFEMTKYFNCHQSTVIVGKPQSGKTSLLYSFFKSKDLLRNVYDKIFLFQPSASRASMQDNIFESLDDNQVFEEMTLENLQYVDDNLEGNTCIIMDDMGAYLKDKEIKKKLKELMFNRRHKKISIFFLVQTWYSIEKDIRKLFSNIIVFRCSKIEMETIFKEVVEEQMNLNEIVKLVYDKPHQYLFIHLDTQSFFKGFDKITF